MVSNYLKGLQGSVSFRTCFQEIVKTLDGANGVSERLSHQHSLDFGLGVPTFEAVVGSWGSGSAVIAPSVSSHVWSPRAK